MHVHVASRFDERLGTGRRRKAAASANVWSHQQRPSAQVPSCHCQATTPATAWDCRTPPRLTYGLAAPPAAQALASHARTRELTRDAPARFKATCDAVGFDLEGPAGATGPVGQQPGRVRAWAEAGDSPAARLHQLLDRWASIERGGY
jgi:hypothetical protein